MGLFAIDRASSRRRRHVSVGARFALATVGVLSVVFFVLYWQLAQRERAHLVSSKVAAGEMLTDVFARSLQGPLEFHDDDAIAAEMKNLDGNAAIRSVLVWGSGGDPIARLGPPTTAPRPIRDEAEEQETRVVVTRHVLSPSGGEIGVVRVEVSLAAELTVYRRTRFDLLIGAAVLAFGTSGLLVAIARRQIVAPLKRVATAAAAIGQGHLSARATNSQDDEIGELAAAFNQMADSLEDRDQRLETVTHNLRDLVDHMRQAIVAFDGDGRVLAGGSRQAARIFGSDALAGQAVRDLLYPGAPAFDVDVQAFEEWRALAFAIDVDGWDAVASYAPKELMVGPERTPVTLEFRPIVRKGKVVNVMLLATDVSHERLLERAAQTQEEEYARRLRGMRRLLLGGSQAFVAFVESAQARLVEARGIVAACGPTLATQCIDALFRAAHTIRGEARAFDMRDLERDTERLEEVLDELRSTARGDGLALTDALRDELARGFETATVTLNRERDLFAEASPIGSAVFRQVTVQKDDLAAITAYAAEAGGVLRELVDRLRGRPLGDSAVGLLEAAPAWAAAEGKSVEVVVERGDTSIGPELVPTLPGILAHLIRNAIAHGIELPAERRALGKPDEGRILISATSDPKRGPSIVVEDDGRGLDVAALRARAPDSGASIEELIFRPGFTTRTVVDGLAGRGVGLDAVRSDLAAAGYVVAVASEVGHFTRFTLSRAIDLGAE
jgi:two-component system, chemotaxis family, sensor kinase CheA